MPKNSEPLYQKIANDITNDIGRGMYKPGSPLYKQSEYARSYGTSCGTVKKAFAALKKNGLIHPVKGHGTYVIAFESSAEHDSGSYRGDLLASNQSSTTQMVSQGVAYANSQVAENLEIEPHAPCYRIQLIRSLNGQPLVFQNIYIRYDRVDNINFYQYDFSEVSLFSLYAQYLGTENYVTEKSLHAVTCPDYICPLLSLSSAVPVLFIKSVLKHDSVVIEYNESYERTDLRPHKYKKIIHPK